MAPVKLKLTNKSLTEKGKALKDLENGLSNKDVTKKHRVPRNTISIWVKSKHKHCIKSVHIWSCSGPHFPAVGLNTEPYIVSLRIQSKCGKMQTRIAPNTDIFHALKLTALFEEKRNELFTKK